MLVEFRALRRYGKGRNAYYASRSNPPQIPAVRLLMPSTSRAIRPMRFLKLKVIGCDFWAEDILLTKTILLFHGAREYPRLAAENFL